MALRLVLESTSGEPGKLSLDDVGTDVGGGVLPADANAWVRLIRADGAGYLTRNASFDHAAQQWNRDDTTLLANLIESGAGTLAFYIAPSGPNPVAFATAIGIELSQGLSGVPVVLIPVHVKIGDAANKQAQNGLLEVAPVDPGTVAQYVKGEPSATANIAEMHRGDTGQLACWIGPGGALNVGPGTRAVQLSYSAGGGVIDVAKAAAAIGAPGPDCLRFYVRAGTNPNTLRLVVLSGTQATETTVLDNLPA